MDYSKIGVRYAKALFELADEKSVLTDVITDMRGFDQAFRENTQFANVLSNPVLDRSKKFDLLDAVFASNFQKLTIDFLRLVIKQGREEHFPAICRRLEYLYKEKFGIKSLELISAIELDRASISKLEAIVKSALQASTLELTTKVDPDIIGGFVLNMDDLKYDASVKAQLAQLSKNFK